MAPQGAHSAMNQGQFEGETADGGEQGGVSGAQDSGAGGGAQSLTRDQPQPPHSEDEYFDDEVWYPADHRMIVVSASVSVNS